MRKIIVLFLVALILLSITSCTNQEETQTTTEPVIKEAIALEYESVTRPIKDFWLIDKSILALTETGELYCGPIDTPNPVFIIDNVKEVKMSEDYLQGLVLLKDGRIIRINNGYESDDHISIIHEILYHGTIQNVENKIVEASAKSLFNHYLYINHNNELCNIFGDVLLQGEIKDGHIFQYSDNAGTAFSGVFLFADNTVKHYFTLHGDVKIREIANNVKRLYCLYDGLYENSNFSSNRCCIIKENGDLLFWKLDEYSYEDTPLNPINRIAQNANSNYDVYCTPYENSYIYYVNNHNLMKYSCETNSTEMVYSNVKEIFYGNYSLDLQKISIDHPAVLTMDNKLIRTDDDKIIAEDVIEILDNGKFIIYGDYFCGRFDGDSSYNHRLNNVKYAESYGLQAELQCQVFLKHGGALYASNDPYGTIYKTAFCEKTLTLYYMDGIITPKQSIQINNGEPMLPYDECCEIFGLINSFDTINNSVIIENNEVTAEFFVGQNKIKVNDSLISSNASIYKDSNGLIWIPLKYIAEAFDYNYKYDAEEFEIIID